jgi:hypothetical protein
MIIYKIILNKINNKINEIRQDKQQKAMIAHPLNRL